MVFAIRHYGRADSMTEPDHLSIKIRELMDWQTVAWRRVADRNVTTSNAVKFEITSKRVMMSYGVAWRYGPNSFSLAARRMFGAGRWISSFAFSLRRSKLRLNERPSIWPASSIVYPKADYCGLNPSQSGQPLNPSPAEITHRRPSTISPWAQAGGPV
jgi:hypothetical protein